MPPDDAPLLAACANCASWMPGSVAPAHATARAPDGACAQGLAPPPGEPRCDAYAVSPGFRRLLVSRLMQDPQVIPVPLRGKAARAARKARRQG